MIVYKVKQISLKLALKKKEIKGILLSIGAISASWAIKDAKGLLVELQVDKGTHTETTLYLTEACVLLLSEVANAREYAALVKHHKEEVAHG